MLASKILGKKSGGQKDSGEYTKKSMKAVNSEPIRHFESHPQQSKGLWKAGLRIWVTNSALCASSGNQMDISKPSTNHHLECDGKVPSQFHDSSRILPGRYQDATMALISKDWPKLWYKAGQNLNCKFTAPPDDFFTLFQQLKRPANGPHPRPQIWQPKGS
ncbi:hypothetical protein GLOIN_2v1481900 [Rhizophagus irregularis DAOM 181602=DAOM 197198]|nr:hypothetical protein GLOIN_2v1481900 [Rhizophagus irregularis DAOM 181602=DAOM 197198]